MCYFITIRVQFFKPVNGIFTRHGVSDFKTFFCPKSDVTGATKYSHKITVKLFRKIHDPETR